MSSSLLVCITNTRNSVIPGWELHLSPMLIFFYYASSEINPKYTLTDLPPRRVVGVLLSVASDGGTTPDDTIYDFDIIRVSSINADRHQCDLLIAAMQERIAPGVCKHLRSCT